MAMASSRENILRMSKKKRRYTSSCEPMSCAKWKWASSSVLPFHSQTLQVAAPPASEMSGSMADADDLAQETLVKAWQSRATFIPGTNLKAWLFTILRNQFYSDRRRAWRQAPWDQEAAERIPGGGEDQVFSAQLSDTVTITILQDSSAIYSRTTNTTTINP